MKIDALHNTTYCTTIKQKYIFFFGNEVPHAPPDQNLKKLCVRSDYYEDTWGTIIHKYFFLCMRVHKYTCVKCTQVHFPPSSQNS